MKLHRFAESEIDRIKFKYGVYIIFEEGEVAHDGHRIVRVGTTTGNTTTLADRLHEHYKHEGRSIWRNHIALCFLLKNGDPSHLAGLFLQSKIDRDRWKKTANIEELQEYRKINETVSNHIRNRCFFVSFPVEKDAREKWEERIISTVYSCTDCKPSQNWLGNVFLGNIAPRRDIIRKSGLWNVQGVNDRNILTDDKIGELENIIVELPREKSI
jgi:hypothetical protein